MKRVEKYQKLYDEVNKQKNDNSVIFKKDKDLKKYQKELLAINNDYFYPIVKKIGNEINLLNLENNFKKTAYTYLNLKDKYLLIKILSDINNFFEIYNETKNNFLNNVDQATYYSTEYNGLISELKNKTDDLKFKLTNKMDKISIFVSNVEQKYSKKYTIENNKAEILLKIKNNNNELKKSIDNLNYKYKVSNKFTFLLLFIILFSSVLSIIIVVLLFY